MTRPGFLSRWLLFLALINGGGRLADLRRPFDPASQRQRQRSAAHQARLSTLPPDQRALVGLNYGDHR
ncbi:hypothetical protein GVN21_16730 [Caulobacter sp. SLTY]|uniref:hypothetical protein n=1 Tax=Caulobacter sp. SLTY TaxID=2683262 RepID=UPI001412F868|nr:hypothetical protein [Caulobacter sp. SLTY]NBB17013.1 hypothetical protein [Caulobacter sp. SLTY]